MTDLKKPKLVIIGGGVAGLTIAHECIDAGIDVHLYEKEERCGGKACCYINSDGYYVEHSMRIYPAYYCSLYNTLNKIPYQENKTVFNNLNSVPKLILSFVQVERPDLIINLTPESTFKKAKSVIKALRSWGMSWQEIFYIFWIALQPLFMSEKRQQDVLWTTTFTEYFKLNKRSTVFKEFVVAIAELITAAKSEACAAAVAEVLCRRFIISGRINPYHVPTTLMMMNGPTCERFIDPWVKFLKEKGVQFHMNNEATTVEMDGKKVKGIFTKDGSLVQADAYAFALPDKPLSHLLPSLQLHKKFNHEWCFSIMYFLNEIPEHMRDKKVVCLLIDSPWRLTYELEAPPMWEEVTFLHDVKAIISVVVNNTNHPGLIYKRPLLECSWDEVQEDILCQMKMKDLKSVTKVILSPNIKYISDEEYQQNLSLYEQWEVSPINRYGYRWLNGAPHYIPAPHTYDTIPDVKTDLPGVFLAGEFVKCHIMLPLMEHASVTGKLCTKEICHYLDIPYNDTSANPPRLPLQWWRNIDTMFYKLKQRKESKK